MPPFGAWPIQYRYPSVEDHASYWGASVELMHVTIEDPCTCGSQRFIPVVRGCCRLSIRAWSSLVQVELFRYEIDAAMRRQPPLARLGCSAAW